MRLLNADDLEGEIKRLQEKRKQQEIMLKAEFNETKDRLKPGNIVKTAITQFAGSTVGDLKSGIQSLGFKKKSADTVPAGLLMTALSFLIGTLAKKYIKGGEKNAGLIKNFMGNSVETILVGIIAKYSTEIRSWATAIFNEFFGKEEESKVTY